MRSWPQTRVREDRSMRCADSQPRDTGSWDRHRRGPWVAALGAAVVCGGCELGVTNPGRVDDEALNDPAAAAPLVVGMAGDFAAIYDDIGYFMGIASGDITHTGAFEEEEFMQRGEIEPRHVNELWGEMQQARWVAESGIERMREVMGDDFATSPLALEAHLWAGFSNRVLGENACVAIINGSEPRDHMEHFSRAEEWFTEAISMAQQEGEAGGLLEVAFAGRAQARAALGDWAGARADAELVPDDLLWEAQYDEVSLTNWLFNQSHRRDYFSVINTLAHELSNTDPRMPFTDMEREATDGVTPMLRQDKYLSLAAPIAVAQGAEMRLIEAEAALRIDGDIDAAMERINHVRAVAGVEPKSGTTLEAAWQALRTERSIVLWMEARRLWDLRRFDDPFLDGRDECIPPSEEEQLTNPNLGS